MSNKIKYGLENVHVAVVTEAEDLSTVSYSSSPKHIPGAVSLSLAAVGENSKFYADNRVYYEETTNDGYNGSLEIALIPDWFRVDVLGNEIDNNEAIIENANAKIKKFALMFEFSGDAKKTRHVLYNVLPTRPNVEGATKTNIKDPKPETLNISARPAIDTGDVKAKLKQGETGYNSFYTTVYLKDAVINTAGAQPAPFNKGNPVDVEVTSTSDGNTAIKNVILNGLPVPGVSLTIGLLKVTIAKEYISSLSLTNGTYPLVIEFTKGNSVLYILVIKD